MTTLSCEDHPCFESDGEELPRAGRAFAARSGQQPEGITGVHPPPHTPRVIRICGNEKSLRLLVQKRVRTYVCNSCVCACVRACVHVILP